MSKQSFIEAYIEAMLWAEHDFDTCVPFEDTHEASDIEPDSRKEIESDCAAFYEANSGLWDNDAQAGHDFYLTRNGHGAGFWDGDYLEPNATELTRASKAYGTQGLYASDDGKLYTHN